MKKNNRGEVQQALRDLRSGVGLTQQALAVRLGKAVATIARWETSRAPRGAELAGLFELAVQEHRPEIAEVFARAMADELCLKAERIPRTIEEGLLVDLLLLAMRNRPFATVIPRMAPEGRLAGTIEKMYAGIAQTLVASFKLLDASLQRGEKVYGLNADAAEILRGEVEALNRDLKKEIKPEDSPVVKAAERLAAKRH